VKENRHREGDAHRSGAEATGTNAGRVHCKAADCDFTGVLPVDWQENGLVFTTSKGTPLSARNVIRSYHRLLEDVNSRDIDSMTSDTHALDSCCRKAFQPGP
jgi:hypothetical protein